MKIKPALRFKANKVWKAFFLNSLAVALISTFAVEMSKLLDKYFEFDDSSKNILTFAATFLTSLLVYFGMFFIFGYGGGLLADPSYKPKLY